VKTESSIRTDPA